MRIESRADPNREASQFDVILQMKISRENLATLVKLLTQSASLFGRVVVTSASSTPPPPLSPLINGIKG